jgi:sulfatase modifying factor 1
MPLPENQLLAQGQYRLRHLLQRTSTTLTYQAESVLEMRPLLICEFFPADVCQRDAISQELQVDPLGQPFFASGLRHFLRAAAILQQTYSPHLCRVYDFFEDLGTGFLVMAAPEGFSLARQLSEKRQPLSPAQVQKIGAQLVVALAPLHRQGLFHVSLQPEDLYLTGESLSLMGWGQGRLADEVGPSSSSVQMSSALRPHETVGAWTDIFALASLLYRLLTGYPPPEPEARLLGVPFESALGEPWDMLFNSALQLNPQQRPQEIESWWYQAFPPLKALSVTQAGLRTNHLGMSFVLISPGSFLRGSPENEPKRSPHERLHTVTLTVAFAMQTTTVTQAQWVAVMGSNPSFFQGLETRPVERVSWEDCQKFIYKLNQMGEGHYRLPTEAEWEYACRAGTTTPFGVGNGYDLGSEQACFNGHYPYGQAPVGPFREETLPVASFAPNAWGLYDMHGNVFEWCQDWYADYPQGPVTDPTGPSVGTLKVERGGCWSDGAANCRSAFRLMFYPVFGDSVVGLRLVRSC